MSVPSHPAGLGLAQPNRPHGANHDVVMREEVVLLDEKGAALGSAPKETVHGRVTRLHLGFSCYLVNPDGLVLLTRRAPTKATWPEVWTNSCCGHPMPGEAIVDAVKRRLRDELGTSAKGVDLILPAFRYRAVMENGVWENELCPVFRAWVAEDIDPNPLEVAELRWYRWDEVVAIAAQRSHATAPWFRAQVAELDQLPGGPRRWLVGDVSDLPPAAAGREHPARGAADASSDSPRRESSGGLFPAGCDGAADRPTAV